MACTIIYRNDLGVLRECIMDDADSAEFLRRLENKALLSGEPFVDLCEYHPELWVKVSAKNDMSVEFCLDCGQAKLFENQQLFLDSDFFVAMAYVVSLRDKYFL